MAEEPQEQSGEQMVTIERFRDMVQAEMAKGRLDSAGIRSFLAGENGGTEFLSDKKTSCTEEKRSVSV